jgi:hypothetical protein
MMNFRICFALALLVGATGLAQAQTTNIIWEAKVDGEMAIQQHDTGLDRTIERATFKTKDFVKMIFGFEMVTNQVLALNINVFEGKTNLFLSIYNKPTRQNIARVTTNEVTVLLQDNKQYSSASSGTVFDGRGELRIVGKGKQAHGFPITQTGKMNGYLIDPFPNDIGGTTGLILRATVRTSGKPLRVDPIYIPPSL